MLENGVNSPLRTQKQEALKKMFLTLDLHWQNAVSAF